MKILHTADWHLGKRLERFSRLEEQKAVLEEIITIADKHEADMVLIAGDLFDSFNPPVEAIELFYKTLKRLSNNGKRPIIAIAGNHDAPDRIDAPNPLAKECGIILIGHPNTIVPPFDSEYFRILKSDRGFIELTLKNIDFPVRIIHTPYANEVRLREYFGEEKDIQLNLVLQNQWSSIADKYCDEKGVNILLTHLYMNKRGATVLQEPESEKPLRIGNSDMVFSDCIPLQIQYTALGHLHSFNNIGMEERPTVYASSILNYSFSEVGQTQYVSLVDIEPQGVKFEKIPLECGKPLVIKSFDSVKKAASWLENHQNAWVELTVETETFMTATERNLIYQSHGGIVHLIPKVKNTKANHLPEEEKVNLNQNIQSVFRDYFKYKHNNLEPNKEIMDLFNEILTRTEK